MNVLINKNLINHFNREKNEYPKYLKNSWNHTNGILILFYLKNDPYLLSRIVLSLIE